VALVASLVLVPVVMLMLDLTTLAYWRVKLQNMADAIAIGAVAESRSLHIPIPTGFMSWVPVEGVLLSGIHLKNLELSLPTNKYSEVGDKLRKLIHLNRDAAPKASISLGKAVVQPVGNFVSPFMYVRVPVTGTVKLQTPFLARALGKEPDPNGGKAPTVKIKVESCSMAWYRIDRWFYPWSVASPGTVVEVLDQFFKFEDEPNKYYRLIKCPDDKVDFLAMAEVAITEHLRLQGRGADDPWDALGFPDAKDLLRRWKGEKKASGDLKRTRDTLKEALPEECVEGAPCLEGADSVRDWVERETERNRAEEEAERARKEAAEQLAQQAGQQADAQAGSN
jgi:hypothetical protein